MANHGILLVFIATFLPMMISHYRIAIVIASLVLLASCSGQPAFDDRDGWDAPTFYQNAKSELNSNNYEKAIELYRELEARFPYGKYAEQAQLDTAYAYYKQARPELALAEAERFIRLHPTHAYVDYAYYLKGLASFVEDNTFLGRFSGAQDLSDRDPRAAQNAYDAFRELVTRFPNSRYALDAKQRMRYLFNALAKHDVLVAKFYLDREAYVAVVNRAKHVIENYQETPAVEDALGILAIAYRNMGMNQLAEDTLRVLALNFPSSEYLK